MSAFGYRKIADLPAVAPLFPLVGAILFPRGALPLNIFEPRYLNMVDDALAGDRIIAMIQPAQSDDRGAPALSAVGAIGRITTFAETDDGRYLITLTGVCRFRVARELPQATPYRRAELDYADFAADLERRQPIIDRDRLRAALSSYVRMRGFETDWEAVDEAQPEDLVNAVAALCPFDTAAKQALLEAPTIEDRASALISLLEWGDIQDGAGGALQ